MMKDADSKVEKARKFVEGLKPKYGAALISTLCLIYKATGNRLTLVGSHDREGHIGDSPYPLLLENGQWGAFLHVCEPLRTQINGAPLEDARHMAYHYDKLCQDVEAKVTEVLRRRSKSRDLSMSGESSVKLQSAEARLADLKSSTVALGREATAAMLSMTLERQSKEFSSLPMKIHRNGYEWLENQDNNSQESDAHQDNMFFIAKVASHGWSEGECNNKAGWFPSAYIEREEKAPTSNIAHSSL
ncbi:hypothetical protein FEM48_Zijuj11G0155000 [Ziziphus jujuba var. spinosa]|uniref:SH3 domain-containing protein n=1 Tax=Ziziphus jujuba var. spinosa TaxID=714518 RepID=A0A978UJS0_ZIZJJ|nr:hypothetical protein FEM48_Zijuj11G0155000 [Ziziphus jujuba var. spinosa]